MPQFMSLNPKGLPEEFDVRTHSEVPVVNLVESHGEINISYVFPGFYLSDDVRDVKGKQTTFKQLNISHVGFLAESGKPLLPSFGRYVQIPPNCEYKVAVKTEAPVVFDDVLVLPAQEFIHDGPTAEQLLEYDREMYVADEVYPKEIVQVTGPFEFDGYHALLVHVCPFQYEPAKRRLKGFGNVSVTIQVKASPKIVQIPEPDLTREAYGNLVLNPKKGIAERLGIGGVVFPKVVKTGPEFLIIYHDSLKDAAVALAAWKNRRGLRTEILSLSAALPDTKSYIRAKRSQLQSRLGYVLLLGDTTLVPIETRTDDTIFVDSISPQNVTDYYSSTKADPVAQATPPYVLPWLAIGRIPLTTLADATKAVNKIIAYEKNPPTDPDYYQRVLFATYLDCMPTTVAGQPAHAVQTNHYYDCLRSIRDQMDSLGFDTEGVFSCSCSAHTLPHYWPNGNALSPKELSELLSPADATQHLLTATSEGRLLFAHRDHGESKGWYSPALTGADMLTIHSATPSVFYSVNCLTGKMDEQPPTDPAVCFAEDLLLMDGGVPSVIAATRESQTWLNDDLMKGLFDATWSGVLPTFPATTASYPVTFNRLGDILNYAKFYLPVKMSGSADIIKDHFEIYHVVGDPTLELWKGFPGVVSMKVSVLLPWHMRINLSECPTGSVITIWVNGRLMKRIEPTSTTISVPPSISGQVFPKIAERTVVDICFWAPQHRFVQKRLTLRV